MPTLFVIAGCNGAGKTTLSKNLLPEYLGVKEFVNADEIARGLSPFNPEGVAFTAGRIMLERIRELAKEKIDFAIETTLASRTYESLFKALKAEKYKIVLLFVFLSSSKEAIRRVKIRVDEGGHNIPREVIERRYERGLKNFKEIYLTIADGWVVFDNTNGTPILVARMRDGKVNVLQKEVWNKVKSDE
jgi:predicted ABC-type ATPase